MSPSFNVRAAKILAFCASVFLAVLTLPVSSMPAALAYGEEVTGGRFKCSTSSQESVGIVAGQDQVLVDDEKQEEDSVTLELHFPQKKEVRKFKPVAWKDGQTVFEVLEALRKREEEFEFKYRGKGSTLFVFEIAGVENEGGRGNNWVFLVDEKVADRSAGVMKVEKGAKIVWRYGSYKPQ